MSTNVCTSIILQLTAVADREGCKIIDVHTFVDNDVLFEAYYVTLPWLVVYKNVCFSANLVKTTGGVQ